MKGELSAIWKSVLNRDLIADDDDFFVLGGDSATALALVLQIEDELDLFLEPSVIYENRTFGAFVVAVEEGEWTGKSEDF